MVETADFVIVGGGTIGGWASVFAAADGAGRVVVLEREEAGIGASSRAAGVVRAQGGTPETVALGMWSIDFYRHQRDAFGTDSGFRELGYIILARTRADERAGRDRVAMQRGAGLDAQWLSAPEACAVNPTLAGEGHRGGSYFAGDGCIDPPRNVRAYSLAMQRAGVELLEHTAFVGVRTSKGRVTGVETPDGVIATERVLLTGGPSLRAVGKHVGARVLVGAVRHQVAVSEPHPAFAVDRLPMVFDLTAGLYWRLEEGGLLWGMSNPNEPPGEAREIDAAHLRKMQRRLGRIVPATAGLGIRKSWAATIEYCPDHLPILGPVITTAGETLGGVTLATASGHGMMWGPAVARVAADLALVGATTVTDVSRFGMDRFDEHGRSPLYDPIALPFPVGADE
ncbi:MAG TPA: FAD-binding oxidoreductase [Actinomycetota bacterium]|jgi:sarcosine oxidase subunit beta|nr:FAD-binding oxidoreductase [Actinomycetota bacterium]